MGDKHEKSLKSYQDFLKEDEGWKDEGLFLDNFGWYCKKYYFEEDCGSSVKFKNSEFYDLMEIINQNKKFLNFCLYINEVFEEENKGKLT